jgi:hypothetical protein
MLIRTQSRVEPAVAAKANPSHPLAHSLAGCWLLNEGAGRTVHDVSGYRHDGSLAGGPAWSTEAVGRAITFDGNDDWISMGDCLDLSTDDITILALLQYSAANQPNEWSGNRIGAIAGKGYLDGAGRGYGLLVGTSNQVYWQIRSQTNEFSVASDIPLNDGQWHRVIGVCDRNDSTGVRLYVDGVRQTAMADATTLDGIELNGSRAFAIGSRQEETNGTWFWDFLGSVAMVCVWKRVLTDAEIRRLQQDPFEMFARRHAANMLTPAPGTVVQCTGSIQVIASISAAARATRDVAGVAVASASVDVALSTLGPISLSAAVHSCSSLHGALSVVAPYPGFNAVLQTTMAWQREALFNGATHSALKLGTVLTQGWFWTRRRGCTTVYRGQSLAEVDLSRTLYVAEPDAVEISLPACLSHAGGSTHCYLVRRFNGCGYQEKTVAAASILRVLSDGQPAPAQPNAVWGLAGTPTDPAGVRLIWLYCPLDQKTSPAQFNLYRAGADGEIDWGTPMGAVRYEGRKFYCFRVAGLTVGQYSFVVRAARADAVDDMSPARLAHEVVTTPPEPAVILAAEPV